MADWRVGSKYGIHVYEGPRPVGTFLNSVYATEAVAAVNNHRNMETLTNSDWQLIADALGYLWGKKSERRAEIIEMAERTGVMLNVD